MGHDTGNLGYGIVGGKAPEGSLFFNQVANGLLITVAGTPSAQITGTGNGTYVYAHLGGIVHVDGTVKEIAASTSSALEAAGNIMANGSSRVYAIIAWKNPVSGAVALKVVPGTVALTAAVVPPTTAEIEATIALGAVWVHIANHQVDRDGDTSVAETIDNTVRPSLIVQTANRN